MKNSPGTRAHRLGTQVAQLDAQVGEQAMNTDQVDRSQTSASHPLVSALFAQTAIKSALSSALAAASLALALNLLSACQPPSSSQGPQRGSELQPSSPSSSPQGPSSGTGDTGGGTGFRNNFYEAYTTRIDQTQAYIQFVEPVLKHHDELLAKEYGAESAGSSLRALVESIVRSKKWYIVPAALSEIAKETHAIKGIQIDPTRYGLQTDNEVIFPKAFWDDPGTTELSNEICQPKIKTTKTITDCANFSRATAIWHEVMLAAYMMRYQPFEKVCVTASFENMNQDVLHSCAFQAEDIKKRAALRRFNVQLDPAQPPKSWADLGPEDYSRVRQATEAFLNRGRDFTTSTGYKALLSALDFDQRIFGPLLDLIYPGGISSSKRRVTLITDVIRSIGISGVRSALPQKCRHARSENWLELRTAPCEVKFSQSEQLDQNSLPTSIQLAVSAQLPSTEKQLAKNLSLIIPIENNAQRAQHQAANHFDVWSNLSEPGWSVSTRYAVALSPEQNVHQLKLGDTVWVASFALFTTGVRAIHLKTAVVVRNEVGPPMQFESGVSQPRPNVRRIRLAEPTLHEREDLFIELNDRLSYSQFESWSNGDVSPVFEFPLN